MTFFHYFCTISSRSRSQKLQNTLYVTYVCTKCVASVTRERCTVLQWRRLTCVDMVRRVCMYIRRRQVQKKGKKENRKRAPGSQKQRCPTGTGSIKIRCDDGQVRLVQSVRPKVSSSGLDIKKVGRAYRLIEMPNKSRN